MPQFRIFECSHSLQNLIPQPESGEKPKAPTPVSQVLPPFQPNPIPLTYPKPQHLHRH